MKTQSRHCRVRRGVTIVELLAVFAVIGVLISLLLPAIQQSRAAARMAQCKNNMRQIGLAMHNYHGTHGVLPPGMFNYLGSDINDVLQPDGLYGVGGPSRSCWMQRILPHLDQQALYSQLPFDSNTQAQTWGIKFGAPIWTIVPPLMCPADPANPKNVTQKGTGPEDSQGFHGNIVMCSGSTEFGVSDQHKIDGTGTGHDLNGMFYALSSTKFTNVTDGLTNTVMGSELIINRDWNPTAVSDGGRDTRGRYYNSHRGGVLFSTKVAPNTLVPDEFDSCVPNVMAPCNETSVGNVRVLYARSYHAGGVNVILGDGSVRLVSENISAYVFRDLGTRAGGETANDF